MNRYLSYVWFCIHIMTDGSLMQEKEVGIYSQNTSRRAQPKVGIAALGVYLLLSSLCAKPGNLSAAVCFL